MNNIKFKLFGAEVFLDRLTPPEDGFFDYEFKDCKHPDLYQSYACTFTIPDISDSVFKRQIIDFKDGKIMQSEELRKPKEQLVIMRGYIHSWMKDFQKNLRKIAPRSYEIKGYLITYELTKAGLIHAHGLILVENMYSCMVSQVMTQTWLNISGGSWKAMQKISMRGGHFKDKAFDKCNSVNSWIRYILKKKEIILASIYLDQCKDLCDECRETMDIWSRYKIMV